jgi:hypothetical protein
MSEICSICSRKITPTCYADEHHLIPVSQGGKYTTKIKIHRICHDKIHSVWQEHELSSYFNTPERILTNESMQAFVKWVAKKPPEFYTKTKTSKIKRRRR